MQYVKVISTMYLDNTPLFTGLYPLSYIREKYIDSGLYPDFMSKFTNSFVIIGEPDDIQTKSVVKSTNDKTVLDINLASLEELKTIKGVTDKLAKSILEKRANKEYINSLDELRAIAVNVDWDKYIINYQV